MNILRKAVRWTGLKAQQYASAALGLTDPALASWFSGGTTAAGKAVTATTAMQITTVWACVRVLAETVGSLPWGIYRQDKSGNSEKIDTHPLADVLIGSPNKDMTSLELREAKTANLALQGNGYSLIERNGAGNVASIYPIPAGGVQCRRLDSGVLEYKVNDRGRWETYPQDKIWHWKGFGTHGWTGLSPIAYARESMGLALGAEDFGARLFSQGAAASAIFSIPQWLKDDQRKEARKAIKESTTGAINMHNPLLLEGGITTQPGIFPPEDLQFLQLRQFQVHEICRLFRISPHMIADLERATNNNIEQLSLEFVMYTMLPYFRRIEESAQKWLFKPAERGQFFLRFNFEGLLRADSVARAQLYSIMLQNGVYNRNEVRALENRNRSEAEGMDEYTVQSNMAIIDQLANLVAARAAPAAPAVPAPAKLAPDATPAEASVFGDAALPLVTGALVKRMAELEASNQRFADWISRNNYTTVKRFGSVAVTLGDSLVELARNVESENEKNLERFALDERLAGLAAGDERLAERLSETLDATGKLMDSVTEKIEGDFAELKRIARKPRKAVFDDDGNAIGVEIVDKLE